MLCVGFEPTISLLEGQESLPLDQQSVLPGGIEPPSHGLKVPDAAFTPEKRTDDGIRTHDLAGL